MRANFYIYQEYTIISFLKSKGYTNPKRQCSPIIHELKRQINNYEDTIVWWLYGYRMAVMINEG